jgi:hypothetical protein
MQEIEASSCHTNLQAGLHGLETAQMHQSRGHCKVPAKCNPQAAWASES